MTAATLYVMFGPFFGIDERDIERGRLMNVPDDYLANSPLEICLQAKEVPELNDIFRRTRRGALGTIVRMLGLS